VFILPFRQSIPISSGLPNCTRETVNGVAFINCFGKTPLSDGNLGPAQPDLGDTSDTDQFVVWGANSNTPFMSLGVGTMSVSAIDLYILNYPAEEFGVPNLRLYRTSSLAVFDSNPAAEMVEFDLLNNNELSGDDSTFRKVTMRLRQPVSADVNGGYLIRWTFTDLYRISWLGISEVVFCGDSRDFSPSEVVFQSPASMEPVVLQPSAQVLESRLLTLTCTVASQGTFTWEWRKEDGDNIRRDDPKFSILTSDATRSSMLNISNFNFGDSAVYVCEANFTYPGITSQARRHDVQFPSKILIVDV
jgi:hypothetical protein